MNPRLEVERVSFKGEQCEHEHWVDLKKTLVDDALEARQIVARCRCGHGPEYHSIRRNHVSELAVSGVSDGVEVIRFP